MNHAALYSLLVLVAMLAPGCLQKEVDESIDELESERYVAVLSPAEIARLPYDVRNFTVVDVAAGTNDTQRPWAVYGTVNQGTADENNFGGNCCEHYLATDEEGVIYNLGGEYPWWSEDRGVSWQYFDPNPGDLPALPDPQCRSQVPTYEEGLGEGSIIQAPDGDIMAMSWYPYPDWDGKEDRFYAYLYDSSAREWRWCYNRWHEPFYDRPWQVPVPGPIASQEYGSGPWASLVVSNWWSYQGVGFEISTDGLNYYPIDRPDHGDTGPVDVVFDLTFDPGPEYDYLTPHREVRAMPLPIGGVLFPRYFDDGTNAYLGPDLEWYKHSLPNDTRIPSDHLVLDSSGALHSVRREGTTLVYELSLDGGATWTAQNFTWPEATTVSDATFEWDFQADGSRDLAVISMRVQTGNDASNATDVDLVYHIRGYRESLAPDTITRIGLGDLDSRSGAGNDVRFDFSSLAILPDGGVVVAYADSTDEDPLFAIELELPESYFEEY